VSLYDSVRELSLEVERYELEGLELQARADFLRKTTVVHLLGGGEEGIGEDVTYDAEEHDRQQARGAALPLAGSWTIASFSRHLGEEPSTERFRAWLELYPGLRFKLDANSQWTDDLVAELAVTGAVDSVDFKGHYRGTTVDTPPDAAMYRRVAEGLPDAWLEDPALTDETTPVLEPHRDRVTWDAPIHSVADIEALLWPPRTVNVKPSRFGSVERLFAAYDYCEAAGIGAYGGGQWELGPGRRHIQLLASLFHPHTPNDVAPREFNLEPRPGLPTSPLTVSARATGFLAE